MYVLFVLIQKFTETLQFRSVSATEKAPRKMKLHLCVVRDAHSSNNAYFSACRCMRVCKETYFPSVFALITRVGRVASEMKLPLTKKREQKKGMVFARARRDKRKM